jgi:hypothetical protein
VEQKRVLTPKKNKRRNAFITLLWPERKNGLFFNTYPKRRSTEFRPRLSNVLQHVERLGGKEKSFLSLIMRRATNLQPQSDSSEITNQS